MRIAGLIIGAIALQGLSWSFFRIFRETAPSSWGETIAVIAAQGFAICSWYVYLDAIQRSKQ